MENYILKERKTNMDILRIIVTFSIVLLHVSAGYLVNTDINSSHFIGLTFYNGICRSAVPIFLMLSGMFMIPKEMQGKYLLRKIANLIGCFFLWSFFYAAQGLAIKFILNKTVKTEDFITAIREF